MLCVKCMLGYIMNLSGTVCSSADCPDGDQSGTRGQYPDEFDSIT